MKVKFVFPAEVELDEAIEYYNYQVKGLGTEFYRDVEKGIEMIIEFPDLWTRIGKYTRRYLLKRFPYALMYTIEGDVLLISAVANTRRNPAYYKQRIK